MTGRFLNDCKVLFKAPTVNRRSKEAKYQRRLSKALSESLPVCAVIGKPFLHMSMTGLNRADQDNLWGKWAY